MFERYTESARRALFFARYETSRYGGPTIEVEHLLLGILHEPLGDLTGDIFLRAALPVERIREEVEKTLVTTEKVSTSVEIPFSKGARNVLQAAADEADRFLSVPIKAEHLLMGILLNEGTLAASILVRQGMSLQMVREAIVLLRAAGARDESAPQEYRITVQPTRAVEPGIRGRGAAGRADFEGFTVKELLAKIHDVHDSRIELPSSIDETARYDVSATWPSDQPGTTEHDLICFGLEHFFGVTIAREAQQRDVYVLTAPEGTSAIRSEHDFGGGGISLASATFSARTPILEPPRLGSGIVISELSASNATMENFGHSLQESLDRLVVDETNLEGRFDFHVRGEATSVDGLRDLLRQQLKLVLTPAQRQVVMLVVRKVDRPGGSQDPPLRVRV